MRHLRNGILSIRIGDSGDSVSYIQKQLGIEVDSSFGPKTKAAVLSFQTDHGLTADGVVGPSTFLTLTKSRIHIQFYRESKSLEIDLESSSEGGIDVILECDAISGLPANHTQISKLIKKGREDLDVRTNYMQSKYDDVSDVGPIPDGDYDLELKAGMPFQKTGGGWGVGGWFLDPGGFSRLGYKFGWNRGGFFLHHDGNGIGTGGCIGVQSASKMRTIQSLLSTYQALGIESEVDVHVH